jgi:hypothetical protein
VGEVIVGHLVPVGVKDAGMPPAQLQDSGGTSTETDGQPPDVPLYYIGGAVAHLTEDTAEKLVEFAGLHLQDVRRSQPDATWSELLRQRGYVLNHFVMALPVEKYDPTRMDAIIQEAREMLNVMGDDL